MKPFYIILFIAFTVFLSSCKRKSIESFDQFPVSYTLKGEKADENFIFKAGQVDVFDSLLIITSTPQTIQCIHIYNKNTFQHIISIGDVGKGPSEIMVPGLACIDKLNGIIWYRDMGHQKIWEFDIAEILHKKDYKPTNSIPLPPDNFFIQFECDIPGMISFANTNKNIFISYLNRHGKIIDSLSVPSKLDIYGRIDDESLKFTSNYMYANHPSKRLHAIAYRFADIFAIVDDNGKVISAVQGPIHILQTPDYNKFDQILTTSDIRADERFIYCMYSGEKRMERINGELITHYAKTILVYNWSGKPVASLALEYPLVSFDIDSHNNRLFTFSPETGGIVCYQIPTL